jgi:hypothetical protein
MEGKSNQLFKSAMLDKKRNKNAKKHNKKIIK